MIQVTYEFQTRQQTSLTPRLQQSVKLLQMSTLDFNREISEALSENPFLDEDEGETPYPEQHGRAMADSASTESGTSAASEPEPAATPDKTLADYVENNESGYSGDYPASRNGHATDVGQWAPCEQRMADMLRADLSSSPLGARDRTLVEFIVDALDEDGYLRIPLEDLALTTEFTPPAQLVEWETALHLVQQASVPGLAARNLAECLTLQLSALAPHTAGRDLALQIAGTQLERLARREYASLAKNLDCTEVDIQQACQLIRRLDPKPGRRFARVDPSSYIIPDIFVRRTGKVWVAIPNQATVPRARLHSSYAQLFREASGDRSPMAHALQEARWLLRSIDQRASTIQRVAQAIVARQQTFFDYGEIALRPLMLSEIADELGMHESTVSRATSNKYLATARGVYEFKHFFSRELATQSGGTCSSTAVRALIQEMIDKENPRDPLSDVILTQRLAREGIVVARRTVSKYRAQIKAPPAELRRAL